MSEKPRVGDRVRVTLEGEVADVDLLGRHVSLVGVRGKVPTPAGALTVTTPVAYPVGSVTFDGEYALFRQSDGWRGAIAIKAGLGPTWQDKQVRDMGWVVYEPGA